MSTLTLLQVRQCIATHLGQSLAEVGAQARLIDDLQIDSLALHAVLLDLEEAGAVLPAPCSIRAAHTVQELHGVLGG